MATDSPLLSTSSSTFTPGGSDVSLSAESSTLAEEKLGTMIRKKKTYLRRDVCRICRKPAKDCHGKLFSYRGVPSCTSCYFWYAKRNLRHFDQYKCNKIGKCIYEVLVMLC